jgi:DNA-binding NarL/FixJ family response regulator
VIVDDHPIVLQGLENLFGRQPDFSVVACCTTAEAALEAARTHQPDVMLLDLRMPAGDGLSLLAALGREGATCRRVVLTASASDDDVAEIIRLGASGLVLKDTPPQQLVEALRRVHQGEPSFDPSALGRALERARQVTARGERASTLTSREREVVKMIAGGLRNRDIAERLSISENTVKVHLHNIYEKLGMEGRMELLLFAREEGLV